MNTLDLSRSKSAAIKAVLLLTSFVAMLNETSINVALSDLMGIFGVGVSTIQWLVTGFMLVMAAIVPLTAFIIRTLRVRAIYFISVGLLIAGGLMAGFAPTFAFLLVGRLVQAAGTCLVMLLMMNIVLLLSSSTGTGSAMGLVSLVGLFAPAVAPSLSGLALQCLGWRWIFLIPIALFVLIGIVAVPTLENVTTVSRRKLDLPSVALEVLGFGFLLYGASGLGEAGGRGAAGRILALAIGLALVAVFAVRQLRLEDPLLNIRVFKHKMFALAMVAVFFSILTTFGIVVLMPMLYVQALGIGAAAAGLAMLPGGALNGLTAPLFGKMYDRASPRAPIVAGTFALFACCLAFAFCPRGAPLAAFIALHVAALVSLAAISTISQANGMASVPPSEYPHGTAIMSTLMQLGGGFGSALYTAFFALSAKGAGGNGAEVVRSDVVRSEVVRAGFSGAFLCGAVMLLVPLACAFFVRRPAPLGGGSAAAEPADAARVEVIGQVAQAESEA